MLNLIFGKSKDSTLFWNSTLLKECDRKFHVSEVLDFHLKKGILHLERVEDLLSKSKINLNALFFAFQSLIGLTIQPAPHTASLSTSKYNTNEQS